VVIVGKQTRQLFSLNNYYELENIPGVILIDDIGERFDYERSSKHIELLISKAEKKTCN
jgi:hypothetical protein